MSDHLSREAQLLAKLDAQREVIKRHLAALAAARLQGWRDGLHAAVRYHVEMADISNKKGDLQNEDADYWLGKALSHILDAVNIDALPKPDYSEEDTP